MVQIVKATKGESESHSESSGQQTPPEQESEDWSLSDPTSQATSSSVPETPLLAEFPQVDVAEIRPRRRPEADEDAIQEVDSPAVSQHQSPVRPASSPVVPHRPEGLGRVVLNFLNYRCYVFSSQLTSYWERYFLLSLLGVTSVFVCNFADDGNCDIYTGFTTTSLACAVLTLLFPRGALIESLKDPFEPFCLNCCCQRDLVAKDFVPERSQYTRRSTEKDESFQQVVNANLITPPSETARNQPPPVPHRKLEWCSADSPTQEPTHSIWPPDSPEESPVAVSVDVHRQMATPSTSSEGACGYSPRKDEEVSIQRSNDDTLEMETLKTLF